MTYKAGVKGRYSDRSSCHEVRAEVDSYEDLSEFVPDHWVTREGVCQDCEYRCGVVAWRLVV